MILYKTLKFLSTIQNIVMTTDTLITIGDVIVYLEVLSTS